MNKEITYEGQKPVTWKILIYLLFAWTFAGVCTFSAVFTISIFIDPAAVSEFSFISILGGLLLATISYGSGAFILGTLIRKDINLWLVSIIYLLPFLIIGLLTFLLASISGVTGSPPLFDSTIQAVKFTLYLLIGIPISYYSISNGIDTSGHYSRPGSVLNIPWPHWLWILPAFLFQIVGVLLFFLGALIYVDILITPLEFSLFNITSFIPRLIIVAILYGLIALLSAAYDLLASNRESSVSKFFKVAGVWLLFTIIQVIILSFYLI